MPWKGYPSSPEYGRAAWRNARAACLKAAKWRCEIRLESVCIGAASEVDHIDGLASDPNHQRLRAACSPCHKKVTASQGGGYRTVRDPEPRPGTAW